MAHKLPQAIDPEDDPITITIDKYFGLPSALIAKIKLVDDLKSIKFDFEDVDLNNSKAA